MRTLFKIFILGIAVAGASTYACRTMQARRLSST